MESLGTILSLLIINASSSAPVCGLDTDANAPIHCPPSITSSDVLEFTNSIFSASGLKGLGKGESLVCRVDGVELRGKDGEKVEFSTPEVTLKGAVETQIIQREDEAETRVHILTESNELIRFNPQTKELESIQLPDDFATTYADIRFSKDGKSILSSDIGGTRDLSIDDLFQKSVPQETTSETHAVGGQSNDLTPLPAKPPPRERFQPVDIQDTPAFKNLLVLDNKSGGLLEFPIQESEPAIIQGSAAKAGSVYISSGGDLAISYGRDGQSRIWKNPSFSPFEVGTQRGDVLEAEEPATSQDFRKAETALGGADGKSGVIQDRALALVNSILSLPDSKNLMPDRQDSVLVDELNKNIENFKKTFTSLENQALELSASGRSREDAVDVAIRSLDKMVGEDTKAPSFRVHNGILVPETDVDSANLSSRMISRSLNLSEAPVSTDSEESTSFDYFQWIFLLPEKVRLSPKRRRDFDPTV